MYDIFGHLALHAGTCPDAVNIIILSMQIWYDFILLLLQCLHGCKPHSYASQQYMMDNNKHTHACTGKDTPLHDHYPTVNMTNKRERLWLFHFRDNLGHIDFNMYIEQGRLLRIKRDQHDYYYYTGTTPNDIRENEIRRNGPQGQWEGPYVGKTRYNHLMTNFQLVVDNENSKELTLEHLLTVGSQPENR